jgi:hypothetical protein
MVFRVDMKEKINKYKLKVNYSSKLEEFVEKLDDNTKKDISNGRNTDR